MASHPSFPHPRRLHPKNDAGADQAATRDSQIAARCQISIAVQQQDAILVTKRVDCWDRKSGDVIFQVFIKVETNAV